MTKLRRYLKAQGDGAVAALAKATGRSHTLISRLADGQRGASLETALAISEITGISPRDLLPKINTRKGKKANAVRTRSRA